MGRFSPAIVASLVLFSTGTISLVTSVILAQESELSLGSLPAILAFIGLGLIFWGVISAYIRTEEYAKKALFDAIATSQTSTLNQVIGELGLRGPAVYLPPKYLTEVEGSKVYISKDAQTRLPAPEFFQGQKASIFIRNPPGMLLTPPGAELSKLFEKILKTNFGRVDLQYLKQVMPKLFIEDLEMAKNLEIEDQKSKIRVEISSFRFKLLTLTDQEHSALNSVLTSAIACAFAKATGKPVILKNQTVSEDEKTITLEYSVLEEEAQAG